MPDVDMSRIWETILAIILAAAGCFARLLSAKDKRKMRRGNVLAEIFISGFGGLMVLLLARTVGLTGDWIGLVCGMAGWIGPRVLDMVAKQASQKLGLQDDKKQEGA